MHFIRLLTMSMSAVLLAACGNGGAAQSPVGGSLGQATLPQNMCDLLPQADARLVHVFLQDADVARAKAR